MNIIEKAKEAFRQVVKANGRDEYHLLSHVLEMEKWAKFMLKKYPLADAEIVTLSVWLHDIGHYPLQAEVDHAVRGEERSREFLEKENFSKEKTEKVLHCVRAHRCKDIPPGSLEAKIIAFIDSASHMTDSMYIDMIRQEGKETTEVLAKMERDFRDLGLFPEIKKEMTGLYESWKSLVKAYEKIKIN